MQTAERFGAAKIEDMARQLARDSVSCFSRFLDEREQLEAKRVLRTIKFPEDQTYFWCGFSTEEKTGRRMLGLFPDYLALSNGIETSLWEAEFPIKAVTISFREQDGITHRDILGSLMGLNLKRELIGEIFVEKSYAVIFCTDLAAEVIMSELDKVGRAGIKKKIGYEGALPPLYRLEYHTGTVSSMRLDCVVSLALNISREKSAALIESGSVSLNFMEEMKISKEVNEKDILSIRGSGRFVVDNIGGASKKGRLHLTIGRYI